MIKKHPWIRTVYLYLFSLVGLTLMIIGLVWLLNLGLKIFIFTEADKPESMQPMPPYPPYGAYESRPVKVPLISEGSQSSVKEEKLSVEEKDAIVRWKVDYEQWQASQSKINYLRSRRERDAADALAFILVGLPLYLYHWTMIKREKKQEYESNA